jgi:hypothetical protein
VHTTEQVLRATTQHKIVESMHNTTAASRCSHECTRQNNKGKPLRATSLEAGASNRSGQPAEQNLNANTAMLEAQQLRLFSRDSHYRVMPVNI